MPEISIIMGVRNGGRYLGEAVRSLLNQTFGDWELLLIENGSTDGAVDELEASRPDARIRIIRHAQSIGAGNALIAGCVVATGRYLGVTDITDTTQQSIYAVKDTLTSTGWGDVRADTTNGPTIKTDGIDFDVNERAWNPDFGVEEAPMSYKGTMTRDSETAAPGGRARA